ncbi:MAG: RnfABCDGE type electron transport complex subunit G [Bacteroidota bacterium]|nr:RnfABCDGE type electron transport complex subunit G [Bacteroidota bacterium]MDP3433489.1 RnfABCDGE type electron transport complex subunit G [Bacteroidota bacterium]
MAKKESTFKNMTIALFVITAVAGLALSAVYSVTKEPIAASQKAKINNAIKMVIPEFESILDTVLMPEDGKDSIIVHRLLKGAENSGVAVQTYTDDGFSGRFTLMVGFLPDGSISNIEVLEHKETPGLGTKMALPAFKDQFKGLKIADLPGEKLKVKKDGGTVDAITAATISSRAFCDAVNRAHAINKKGEKQ